MGNSSACEHWYFTLKYSALIHGIWTPSPSRSFKTVNCRNKADFSTIPGFADIRQGGRGHLSQSSERSVWLSKHWAQSRTPQETFYTQVVGQKGHKDLHLLEAKPKFYYFVLSELTFTNNCASITKAEKIIAFYVLPSKTITQTPSQLFFLVTPALFLNCILTALSLLLHFSEGNLQANDFLMGSWSVFHFSPSSHMIISYSFIEAILTAAVPA